MLAPVWLTFLGAAKGSCDMFAEKNEAVLREWRDVLDAQGWKGTTHRLNELCMFLVNEGLTWRMLGLVPWRQRSDRPQQPNGWPSGFAAGESAGSDVWVCLVFLGFLGSLNASVSMQIGQCKDRGSTNL